MFFVSSGLSQSYWFHIHKDAASETSNTPTILFILANDHVLWPRRPNFSKRKTKQIQHSCVCD